MEEQKFKVIIVEDVKLELKGTEEIFRHEIPNAEVIGTAMTESEFWPLMEAQLPDLVLLDLGLGGSTTIGVDICKNIFIILACLQTYHSIFTHSQCFINQILQ